MNIICRTCTSCGTEHGWTALALDGERCSFVTQGYNRSFDSNVAQRNSSFYKLPFFRWFVAEKYVGRRSRDFVAFRRSVACGVFFSRCAAVAAFVDLWKKTNNPDEVKSCQCRLTRCQYSHVDRLGGSYMHRYVLGIPSRRFTCSSFCENWNLLTRASRNLICTSVECESVIMNGLNTYEKKSCDWLLSGCDPYHARSAMVAHVELASHYI